MSEEIKNVQENETPLPEKVEIVGVNFREAGKIYYFSPEGFSLAVGDRVIVETSRGVELGLVKVANKAVDSSEIISPLKPVTRPATQADIEQYEKNRAAEDDAIAICQKKVEAHGLGMKLVGAEYTFDKSKLIFYFTCESRVDFRELVRDLASTFRTRIELRRSVYATRQRCSEDLAFAAESYAVPTSSPTSFRYLYVWRRNKTSLLIPPRYPAFAADLCAAYGTSTRSTRRR